MSIGQQQSFSEFEKLGQGSGSSSIRPHINNQDAEQSVWSLELGWVVTPAAKDPGSKVIPSFYVIFQNRLCGE